jgi:hypothetical protein
MNALECHTVNFTLRSEMEVCDTMQYPSTDKTPPLISKKKVSPYKLLLFSHLTKSHQKYEKQIDCCFSV